MATSEDLRARFFETATVWSRQSTCPKRSVGAVLVRDGCIIEVGYNGAASGQPHCRDVGCFEVDSKCERAVHAEHNLILHAARHGHRTAGAVVYCTLQPCFKCQMFLRNAGVTEWHWLEENRERPGAPTVPSGGGRH